MFAIAAYSSSTHRTSKWYRQWTTRTGVLRKVVCRGELVPAAQVTLQQVRAALQLISLLARKRVQATPGGRTVEVAVRRAQECVRQHCEVPASVLEWGWVHIGDKPIRHCCWTTVIAVFTRGICGIPMSMFAGRLVSIRNVACIMVRFAFS